MEHDDDDDDDVHEPNPKHSTPFHSRAQGTLLQPFLNLTLINASRAQQLFVDVVRVYVD